METEMQNTILIKENLKSHGPAIIAVSGPSGSGKDYLTSKAIETYKSIGIPVFTVQMATERPSRGEVETKICISPDEYTELQKEGKLIGDHVNSVRYGYRMEDIEKAIGQAKDAGGILILELNPSKQANFAKEFQDKMGLELTAWIGVKTTEEQTIINMRERGESEESIRARVAIIREFEEAMEGNPDIVLVDNGPDNREKSPFDFVQTINNAILSRAG